MSIKPMVVVEIDFDHKRQFVLSNRVLRKTETTVNQMRGSTPDNWVSIEMLINNGIKGGILPMDLTSALLFHAFALEDDKLTLDQVGDLTVDRFYINQKMLEAFARYWPPAKEEEEPRAAEAPDANPTKRLNGDGSTAGPSAESSLS